MVAIWWIVANNWCSTNWTINVQRVHLIYLEYKTGKHNIQCKHGDIKKNNDGDLTEQEWGNGICNKQSMTVVTGIGYHWYHVYQEWMGVKPIECHNLAYLCIMYALCLILHTLLCFAHYVMNRTYNINSILNMVLVSCVFIIMKWHNCRGDQRPTALGCCTSWICVLGLS